MDNLKDLLKEDIWKIINVEDIPKRNFFDYVLHMLLGSEKILLKDVVYLSKELDNRYNQILGEVNKYILEGNGEVLPTLKRLEKDYKDKIQPILNEIERYK